MALNALTVDLEEYFQVSNFEKLIDRAAWDTLPSRVIESTHRLLDLFDETESRATFFALGWIVPKSWCHATMEPPVCFTFTRD